METIFSHIGMLLLIMVAFFALVTLVYNSAVVVGGRQIAILERRWFGRKMPQGRVVAMKGEIGVQARTLGPGFHLLIPFLYRKNKADFTVIGTDEVGLVESIDGNAIPTGKIFAKVVGGHNSFQDGEAFITAGGEKGSQIEVIPPGNYRINPVLFRVTKVPITKIDPGTVGVVKSEDGAPIDAGRLLAKRVQGHSAFENGDVFLKNGGQKGPQIEILLPGKYRINTNLFKVVTAKAVIIPPDKVGMVTALDGSPLPETEFVAKQVEGHKDYQDADAFLTQGGQRGPQFDVLRPGTYYINPLMFDITTDDVAKVERGQVAVVVSNVGEEPTEITKEDASVAVEARLDAGIERYVVPKGYRGVQKEAVGPGVYYLNRRAFIPYIIDTTNITIDWEEGDKTKFDPLSVVSGDGFPISVSVKVIIRVRPDQAPYMVAKIGSIENLVYHVIHPMIDSSFRNQASSTSAMNFLQDRQDEQEKAEERTRRELEKYHVECVSVLICQISLPQDLMDTQTQRIIAQQKKTMFEEQQKAEYSRIATEKTRAEANKQGDLMTAEIGVKIAEQNKTATITNASAEGEATKLKMTGEAEGIRAKGEAEGRAIEAKGLAAAKAYEEQRKAIGGDGIVSIEVVKQLAEGKIKVTPDTLIQGGDGGGLSGLLSLWMTQKVTSPNGSREEAPRAEVSKDTTA